MKIVEKIVEIINISRTCRLEGKSIALVPTMGYLHAGHISLIKKARAENDIIIASVFVNPTQFNDPKDLELYPRNLEKDSQMLSEAGVDVLFAPANSEIYGSGFQTYVTVEELSGIHEGEFRPGHFRGVSTVVNILFNAIQPDKSYFGDKDFQQLALIKRMVMDLFIPVEVIGCPIIRESDGFALSSRNVRLDPSSRELAPKIFFALNQINRKFSEGCNLSDELIVHGKTFLSDSEFQIEYLRIIDSDTLEIKQYANIGDRVIIAVWLGGVRLIDNIQIGSS